MLRAIIFDFNGILVDDEPLHFEMLRRVLAEEGITLGKKDYYARYLGMDDKGCFRTAFQEQGRKLPDAALAELIRRKAVYYREAIEKEMVVFPGVKELVPRLASCYPLAIASGALRSEIELILSTISLINHFQVIISADDINNGKPDPEVFVKALSELNRKGNASRPIQPAECLVIEDSKEGVRGARRAGNKVLAVTNSHPAQELTEADAVIDSLEKIDVAFLEKLFA